MLRKKTADDPGRPIGALDRSAVADGGQTLGAPLFTPADLSRRDRRHREKLARAP